MIGLEHYKNRDYFSISSLTAFSRCPRNYFYSSGCRLALADDAKQALQFGTAIHKAAPLAMTGAATNEIVEAFSSAWREELEDARRNTIIATNMLVDLADRFRKSPYELLPPPDGTPNLGEEVSDWEIPFHLDLGLPKGLPLYGKIDGMVRNKHSGYIYALEIKTTSQISENILAEYHHNPQIIGYPMVLKAYGVDCKGSLVLLLRVSPKNTETVFEDISVQPHQMELFIKWAKLRAHQILACEEAGEFPQDISGCNPYPQFGTHGYPCQYKYLCHYDEDWTKMMAMYTVRDVDNIAPNFAPLTIEGK